MDINQILRNELTSEQYEAAVDSARDVLCLACAGSGKSRTLAYRIARLLAEDEDPKGIVAFTFTQKAAESIKRRVAEALLKAGLDATVIGAMSIGTIHSYCHRLLENIDSTYRQFDVLDENRLKLYLISRYAALKLQLFRTGVKSARNKREVKYFDMIDKISGAWKISNDELFDFDEIKSEYLELGELLERVRESLKKDQYLDFSLMVREAVDMIKRDEPGVESGIEHVKHLMVDEYQDVNPSQEELIRLLRERAKSLFVVGDDDQSIYAWRGADVNNILNFEERHSGSKVHTLSKNFRSTGLIVQASDAFAKALLAPRRISKAPSAAFDRKPQDFRALWFEDRNSEAQWVAKRIQDLQGTSYEGNGSEEERGLTWADFAILMRSTRQSKSTRQPESDSVPRHKAFTDALSQLNIPFSLEAGGSPFNRKQVAVLHKSFELLRNRSPEREHVRQFFSSQVKEAYPSADFNLFTRVLTDWNQKIHRPEDSTRIRLYPQQLVYDLLEAFNINKEDFSNEIMREIGLFSRIITDVENVYMSVDSGMRFSDILNFINNVAKKGYDVSTDDILQRPDAVTVSTVHKMKGLEFPCVFVVDVETQRFPRSKKNYDGWIPPKVMKSAIERGAYRSTLEEEARLFYTAITRAERYLYVTGAEKLPQLVRKKGQSQYMCEIAEQSGVIEDKQGLPSGLVGATPRRRIEKNDYPTTFSEIRYFLQCPKSYQFRERFGFNPVVEDMLGYGKTVHTSIQKIHELYPDAPPSVDKVKGIVEDTFHLKHVPESKDPENNPGPYERAKDQAIGIAQKYVANYEDDFKRSRQVEAIFEILATDCVISGSIDLLLREDRDKNIVSAEVIDFKTMEGGDRPNDNAELEWTELALQVQLYARAANKVLGQNARTGNVHFLKDNRRVSIPVTQEACDAALKNIEWAVQRILNADFPMRPHPNKCEKCDFKLICSKTAENFKTSELPPKLHLPNSKEMVQAISQFKKP